MRWYEQLSNTQLGMLTVGGILLLVGMVWYAAIRIADMVDHSPKKPKTRTTISEGALMICVAIVFGGLVNFALAEAQQANLLASVAIPLALIWFVIWVDARRQRDCLESLAVEGYDSATGLNVLAAAVHGVNARWWQEWVCASCHQPLETVAFDATSPKGKCTNRLCGIHGLQQPGTMRRLTRNKPEMIALMHSELSEMLEGVRKNQMDDHLPKRKMEEVEAADLLIRLLDYCGGHGLDLQGAYLDKMRYNAARTDHTFAARNAAGGKKF